MNAAAAGADRSLHVMIMLDDHLIALEAPVIQALASMGTTFCTNFNILKKVFSFPHKVTKIFFRKATSKVRKTVMDKTIKMIDINEVPEDSILQIPDSYKRCVFWRTGSIVF